MPDIEMVDDAYWLKFAKEKIANAIAVRETAAGKIDAFLAIVWGLYTAAFALGTAFNLLNTTAAARIVMALPVIVLPVARFFCMAVLLPVNVEFPVNVVELIRDKGYVEVLEAKKARLARAIAGAMLSVVTIALALFVFKTGIMDGKAPPPAANYFVKATYLPHCNEIALEGRVDSLAEVTVAIAGKDTTAKKWVYQETNPFKARPDGRIDTLIPSGDAHAGYRIFATWTDGKKQRHIIRN